jgi:hypothetical protein
MRLIGVTHEILAAAGQQRDATVRHEVEALWK